MTAAQARPRLGLHAGEAPGRAHIQHLLGAALDDRAHLIEQTHARTIRRRGNVGRALGRHAPGLDRPALGAPFGQAAIEYRDALMTEHLERPPRARGAELARAVIGDHAIIPPDAERTDRGAKLGRARQHVRQGRRVIRDRVDIEEDGTRQMRRKVLLQRISLLGRQIPRGIDDLQIRRANLAGEPRRVDDRAERYARHGASR